MELIPTEIADCYEVCTNVFSDMRGTFTKTYHVGLFEKLGLNTIWREQFWSSSVAGVIRGMHFQIPPQDHIKMVSCARGVVSDVIIDLRRNSATYGKHIVHELRADSGKMMYIPRGMAHGFLTLSPDAVLLYMVETVHNPLCDRGLRWDACGINWPLSNPPIISTRDLSFPAFAEFASPF